MKIFRLTIVFFILLLAAADSSAQTGILRTERSQSSVITFVEGADIIGLSSSHFIDGYVRRYGKDRFIFPVGHGSKAGPFAGDGSGIIGAYYAENPGASTLAGGPFAVSVKVIEIQTVSSIEYWHIDGAEATTLSFTWNNNSGIASLTGSALNKLSVVGWSSANKRWEVIPSQVDAVALVGGSSTLSAGSISTARAIIPDQYDLFTLAGLTSAAAPSDYAGKLETADCRIISGWVYDKNNISSEVVVELVDGAKVYGQVIASNFRADLKANGIGTGKYGFSMPLPEDARDGNYRNLSIRVRGTNFSLEGSPKIVGCGYRGKFESADCYTVKGWTVIGEYPDSSLVVDLLADGQFQGSYAANIYRSDVQALVGGNGKVGFQFELPSSVKTNTPKQLSLRAKDSKFVLDDSPKIVQCAEPQTFGSFEVANCSTLTGWVWDKIYPANALTVEILEGNAVVATGLANIYRADLKAGGFGTGNYAFSIPYPEGLKDGRTHQLSARVKGSNYMLVGNRTVNCLLEVYGGTFESADCNTIRGWAWDKSHPNVAMTVELLADGAVVATTVANTYRDDLKTAGTGTGNYGFSIPLPTTMKDAKAHSYSVRIQGTTYVLGGSPRSMTCAVPSQYGGGFETANCSVLTGWVWDKTYPANALTVEVLEGTTVVASGLANIYRADLKSAGYGTGNYAFNIPLPEALKDGVSHQLSVRVKGSNYMVGSAKTVNCLLQVYNGAFESADCNTIRGWAWDKSHPNVAMTVELLADGAVVATTVANTYRDDLKTAGTGTGNYGFSIPLPTTMKDAKAHSYSVRIQGTTYVLGGSPRSMTCAVPSQYGGGFETANCSVLTGWVWDKTYPANALTVEVLEGTTVVASGLANIYRADLKSAGYGTGNYAFNIPLPEALKDGVSHQLSVRVKGSNYMVGSAKTVNCLLQVYNGAFESADCNTIRGWAWDKSHPNVAMTVELLADGAVVATTVANTYRDDLKTAGTGTGNYGFSIPLPTTMKDAKAHSYSVRIQGTTYVLGGSPRSMTCAVPSQYGGGFETANCSVLTGWVWDKTYPANALTVEVLEGTTVVASGLANIYRADLKSAGYGTGNYAFNIPLPEALKDGVSHQLSVRVKGSNYMVGSAKTVNCLLQVYNGAFESADCNTIRGWAWDKSHPNVAMTVELLADGAVVATTVANTYRDDLKTAGTGTGNYGFSIPLPNNMKDAKAHSYSVRIQGTTYVLGGSPRSMTCAVPSQYGGGFETANCSVLTGWVWDKTYPETALTVEVLEGTTVVASGLANIYRADLKAAGYGTGNYVFSIPLPEALKDGVSHQLSVRVKGSNYMVGSAKTVNCLLQVYNGAFESADCNTIRGWAWDKSHPNVAMTVELLADGAVVATTVANTYRDDLKTAGTGTGNYGFSIPLPTTMKDAKAHSYSVRIQGTTYVLGGSPRSMTCAVPSQYGGGFETANCSVLTGWVWDKTYPANALTVEVLEGTTVVASGLANIYRADLKSAGYGTGNYAFNIPLPEALKDGVSHQLSVRVKGSNYMVGSAKTVNCLLQVYNGAFESADCNTIRGWAWDKSHPNVAMTVELLADGAVVATTVANTYRDDLKTAGTGTGNYGFSIPLPTTMKDAKAHSYSVRIQGTTYVLGGSPRSMTCAVPSQYGGGFETANCSVLTGWVWDKTYPANALTVEVLEGTTVVASGLANIYRADLKSAGYGTGNYAFNIPLPEALKDGVSHQLSVRVKGSNYMVGSAKTVNCASQLRRSSSAELQSQGNDVQQLLDEDIQGTGLTVYPNPTKGKVIAQFHLGTGKIAQISVVNILGRQVWIKSAKGFGEDVKVAIQLEDYPDGEYIVRVVVDGQTQLQRIVLTK